MSYAVGRFRLAKGREFLDRMRHTCLMHHHRKRKQPHFDRTEDRKAYLAGYQHGYKGDEQYRPH